MRDFLKNGNGTTRHGIEEVRQREHRAQKRPEVLEQDLLGIHPHHSPLLVLIEDAHERNYVVDQALRAAGDRCQLRDSRNHALQWHAIHRLSERHIDRVSGQLQYVP